MSNQYVPTQNTYAIEPLYKLKSRNRSNALIYLQTAFNVFAVSLIIMLVARVFFALLLVDGPINNAVIFMTQPFVTPFNNLLPSFSELVPASSALAYCVYFSLFIAINYSVKTPAKPILG